LNTDLWFLSILTGSYSVQYLNALYLNNTKVWFKRKIPA
jgi:hypothetical protein